MEAVNGLGSAMPDMEGTVGVAVRFQLKSAISRSIATVKLAGQPAQNGPRDIEVVPGRRLEHSPYRRLDGPGRFAIQSLSLSRQPQQPSAPIAFVGPSADQMSTLESHQDGCQ
jgi:hypothetical protein